MQNPSEDTEWNSILRSKGILPQKNEATLDEDTLVQVFNNTECQSRLQCIKLLPFSILLRWLNRLLRRRQVLGGSPWRI